MRRNTFEEGIKEKGECQMSDVQLSTFDVKETVQFELVVDAFAYTTKGSRWMRL